MIQIQDDNFNQSAAAPSLNQNSTQTNSTTQPVAVAPSHEDDSKKKTAEIDQLLADLDRLSKNLDEDSTSKSEEVAKTPEAPKVVEPVQPVSVADSSVTEEKKFDFDAFLSDLEKKIDQEANKDANLNKDLSEKKPDFPDSGNPSDIDADLGLDAEPSDFRKNRSTADPQVQDEDTDEMIKKELPASAPNPTADTEELKAQNIFEMLGLANIEDEEKNKFLDDLESMIWDDFIFHDLELLLTSEEYAGARQILDDKSKGEEQQKEDLIAYLEKLVPDLDEVLYDKALELKSEMMGERLAKMKEDADEAALTEIKKAEGLISQNRWKSAVTLLNQLS